MSTLRWKFCLFLVFAVSLWLISCDKDKDCPTCPHHPATLYLSAHRIDLGATGTSATFDIENTGEEALDWTITSSGADWLSANPTSGSNDATVTVNADRNLIETLGQHKAKIYVSAGSLKDSVEVSILYGGKWLLHDDGTFDACLTAEPEYLYFVNLFRMPEGMNSCFVDSVKINFCQAGPMRLRMFNAWWSPGSEIYWPDSLITAPPGQFQAQTNWNTFKVDWYVTTDPFFVGYLQPELYTPDLNYDIVTNDTVSYILDLGLESWVLYLSRVFYIRVYVTPVLEYAPKISVEHAPLDITPREREALSRGRKDGVIRSDKP